MSLTLHFAWVALVVSALAWADDPVTRVESNARDKSAAFVATQNFIVGRFGRDCLEELKRPETPSQYQQNWQHSNAKYYEAAAKYMRARLAEIDDPVERDQVERAYYASAQKNGETAINQLYGQGRKPEVCKYAITMVDAGNMDIEEFGKVTKRPILNDLAELVEWAKSR
jgi:hypothetical protein